MPQADINSIVPTQPDVSSHESILDRLTSAFSGFFSRRSSAKETTGDDTKSFRPENSDGTALSGKLSSKVGAMTETDPFVDLEVKLKSEREDATKVAKEIRGIYQKYREMASRTFSTTVTFPTTRGLVTVTVKRAVADNMLSMYFGFSKEDGKFQPIRSIRSPVISDWVGKVAEQGMTSETEKYGWTPAVYKSISGAANSPEMHSDGYCWVSWSETEYDTELFHFYGLIDTARISRI